MIKQTDITPYIKLKFNLEHPHFEECYADGYISSINELDEQINPHYLNSSAYEFWSQGWWAGFYGEQPLFDLAASLSQPEQDVDAVAANEAQWSSSGIRGFFTKAAKVAGAIAATAVVTYGLIELAS